MHELPSWQVVKRHSSDFLGNLHRLLTRQGVGNSRRNKYLLRLCVWPISTNFGADVMRTLFGGNFSTKHERYELRGLRPRNCAFHHWCNILDELHKLCRRHELRSSSSRMCELRSGDNCRK
jgi:hypothetical protein